MRFACLFVAVLWMTPVSAQGLQGDIKIDGSSTVYPISEAAAAAFNKTHKKVNITVGVSGTGGGFKRFVTGATDISDASRPIKPEEAAQAEANGIKFFELPVAYDGLTFVVPKGNKWLTYLTLDEVGKIFKSPGAKKWSDVREGLPAEPIKVFIPGTDSGTYDYFKEVVIGKDKGSVREDASASEDDNVLVTGISGSKYAIGFFGVAYYRENTDKLNAVDIVNPETGNKVSPSSASIEDGSYAPFSRPLFIYVNTQSFARPEVMRFVADYIKAGAELAAKAGYVSLPKAMYLENRNKAAAIARKQRGG